MKEFIYILHFGWHILAQFTKNDNQTVLLSLQTQITSVRLKPCFLETVMSEQTPTIRMKKYAYSLDHIVCDSFCVCVCG